MKANTAEVGDLVICTVPHYKKYAVISFIRPHSYSNNKVELWGYWHADKEMAMKDFAEKEPANPSQPGVHGYYPARGFCYESSVKLVRGTRGGNNLSKKCECNLWINGCTCGVFAAEKLITKA
jgi:hypothetical protein